MPFALDFRDAFKEQISAHLAIFGGPLKARFINQSIAQALNDPSGRRLDAGAVGLAHAAGVVGHHLTEPDVAAMAAEIARVLAPTGSAVLDAGPAMPRAPLQEILAAYGLQVWHTLRVVSGVSHDVLVFRRLAVMR